MTQEQDKNEINKWLRSLSLSDSEIANSVMYNVKKSKRPHMKKIILEALRLKHIEMEDVQNDQTR